MRKVCILYFFLQMFQMRFKSWDSIFTINYNSKKNHWDINIQKKCFRIISFPKRTKTFLFSQEGKRIHFKDEYEKKKFTFIICINRNSCKPLMAGICFHVLLHFPFLLLSHVGNDQTISEKLFFFSPFSCCC